ncbi:MAG TPA: hypothetical protein VD902_12205 [Symbiobacteriaceae bacterium]|nr:hypothetical protein [Symbiobacteriaceae bacterium]
MNLFRPATAEQGSLTAALLALLEHSDSELLNGLMRRAGLPFQVESGMPLQTQFPAPAGPPGSGLLVAPHFRLAVAAQTPGEPWDSAALEALPGTPLTVTLTGQAPPDSYALSWEQLDRWLAEAGEAYSPDSRTGFLIRQFRAFLPEVGIAYFAGFDQELLLTAPDALRTVKRLAEAAGHFFEQLGPGLATARPEAAVIRRSRPEELLAGYCYSDYSDPPGHAGSFLRVALSLSESALQLAYWLAPGSPPHAALLGQLRTDDAFVEVLRQLETEPLLWLWSPGGEHKLSLQDWTPDALAEVNWQEYHAALQVSLPFAELPGEDLTGRVVRSALALLAALGPVMSGVVH